jgi:hypothetical protein
VALAVTENDGDGIARLCSSNRGLLEFCWDEIGADGVTPLHTAAAFGADAAAAALIMAALAMGGRVI